MPVRMCYLCMHPTAPQDSGSVPSWPACAYKCVCVCVCVCEREREREREINVKKKLGILHLSL